jgi:glycosyltransferase involved in cell wall biosynthesis
MKLSVLINNYNYAPYLRACIDSALAQDFAEVEVVVVDDGSTDGSRAIIADYGDRVVAVLKENGGQASSFNAGFAAASGDVLLLLDSDDAFLPGKLAAVAEVYAGGGVDWCFDRVTTQEGQAIAQPIEVKRVDYRGGIAAGRFPDLFVPTSGLSFRRELLAQILPMATAADVVLSDNYLKFAAAHLGAGAIVETPLTFQRIHAANRYTGEGRAKTLRPRIMVATGVELARRYPGMRALAMQLIAGGVALSGAGFGTTLREAGRNAAAAGLGAAARWKLAAMALAKYAKYRSQAGTESKGAQG